MTISILTQHKNVFNLVKELPFRNVVERYAPGPTQVGKKRPCPFHRDARHPNLHVYHNGGHCFSCGWHGDAVKFVADLHGLRPLDAARQIAGDFGLMSVGVEAFYRPDPAAVAARIAREREVRRRQRIEVAEKYLSLVCHVIDRGLRTPDDLERWGGLVQAMGDAETILDMLADRDPAIQDAALVAFESGWLS